MNVIDTRYFYSGELLLEGLSDGETSASKAMAAEMSRYIDRYGTEYLIKLLGYGKAVEFMKYADTYGFDDDQEADDSVWHGLLKMLREYGGVDKTSPLANYVYFHYVRENQLLATGLGVVVADCNNKVVTPVAKLTRVWNQMADMTLEVERYLYDNLKGYKPCFELTDHINTLGL